MAIKIWNIILLILIGGLIIGIFLNETAYKRFDRSDYYIYVENEEDINTVLLENMFINKDDTINIPNGEKHLSVNEKLLPKKLHLLWFCFEDNKFYEFNGEIDNDLIRKNIENSENFGLTFGKHGAFTVKANYKVTQKLRGTAVLKPWFNKDVNRDVAVFFAQNKVKITPYLTIKSGSEFSGIEFSPVTYHYLSNSSYSADTLINRTFFYKNRPLIIRPFDEIDLKVTKNAGMKPKSEEYFFAPVLRMKIHLDPYHLYEILKNKSTDHFDLHIDLDKNDSLKSIYLSNKKENFKLDTEIKYDLESNQ